MRTIRLLMLTLALVAGFSIVAHADSPITSTPFHEAYFDLAIIWDALETGVLDLRMAEYLSSPDVPIDAKVAVINALGWDIEGKHNAELYALYIALSRGWTLYEVTDERLAELSDDELCCLGYLAVMDDYHHPEDGLPLLQLAHEFFEVPEGWWVFALIAVGYPAEEKPENTWYKPENVFYGKWGEKRE